MLLRVFTPKGEIPAPGTILDYGNSYTIFWTDNVEFINEGIIIELEAAYCLPTYVSLFSKLCWTVVKC